MTDMRRDHFRAVLRLTEVGQTYTAHKIAELTGLSVQKVTGAIRALRGVAFVEVKKTRKTTDWKRIVLQSGRFYRKL